MSSECLVNDDRLALRARNGFWDYLGKSVAIVDPPGSLGLILSPTLVYREPRVSTFL